MTSFLISIATAVLVTSQVVVAAKLPDPVIPSKARIDERGKVVVTYIMFDAAIKLKSLQMGDTIEIVTDPLIALDNDIRAWCRLSGNILIDTDRTEQYQRFYIQKGESHSPKKKLFIVLSEAELGKLITPPSIAMAALLSGSEVNLFFQGPATKVLQKGFRESLGGLESIFSVFARKELRKYGHVSPQEKLRQIKELGGKFYICGGSTRYYNPKKLIFDDIKTVEYFTVYELCSQNDIVMYMQ